MLTEADGMTLANLCQTWSTMMKAQKKLTKWASCTDSNGYIQQSPFFSMVNNCIDIVTKLSREFGLTPAARSRMVAQTETEPEDDLWAILNTPRKPVYPSQPDPKPQ